MSIQATDEDEWVTEIHKYEVMMIAMLVISVIWFAGVASVTFKFIYHFRSKKKLFTLFLILLNWALICRIIFLVDEILLNKPGTWKNNQTYCEDMFISYSGSLFLSLAGIVNIYNWAYFIIKVRPILIEQARFKRKWRNFVNYSFLPIPFIIIFLYGVGVTWGWTIESGEHNHQKYKHVQFYMFMTSSIIYFILSIGFIISGRWLRVELKNFNEDIEATLRLRLKVAVWLLSIPFMIRWLYNFIGAIIHIDSKVMQPSIEDDTWTAPIVYSVYILVADLLPITSQLVSMVVVTDDLTASSVKNSQLDYKSEISEDNYSYMNYDEGDSKIQFRTTKTTSGHFGYGNSTRYLDKSSSSQYDKSG